MRADEGFVFTPVRGLVLDPELCGANVSPQPPTPHSPHFPGAALRCVPLAPFQCIYLHIYVHVHIRRIFKTEVTHFCGFLKKNVPWKRMSHSSNGFVERYFSTHSMYAGNCIPADRH